MVNKYSMYLIFKLKQGKGFLRFSCKGGIKLKIFSDYFFFDRGVGHCHNFRQPTQQFSERQIENGYS